MNEILCFLGDFLKVASGTFLLVAFIGATILLIKLIKVALKGMNKW